MLEAYDTGKNVWLNNEPEETYKLRFKVAAYGGD